VCVEDYVMSLGRVMRWLAMAVGCCPDLGEVWGMAFATKKQPHNVASSSDQDISMWFRLTRVRDVLRMLTVSWLCRAKQFEIRIAKRLTSRACGRDHLR